MARAAVVEDSRGVAHASEAGRPPAGDVRAHWRAAFRRVRDDLMKWL